MVLQDDNDRVSNPKRPKKAKTQSRGSKFDLIPFENIVPNHLKDNDLIKGKIATVRPYSSTNPSIELCLTANNAQIWVLIKGPWIEKHSAFFKVGVIVGVMGKFGIVKLKPNSNSQDNPTCRVEYVKGVTFNIEKDGELTYYELQEDPKATKPRKTPTPNPSQSPPTPSPQAEPEDDYDPNQDESMEVDVSDTEQENLPHLVASGESSSANATASTSMSQPNSSAVGEGSRTIKDRTSLINKYKKKKSWGLNIPMKEKQIARNYTNLRELRDKTGGKLAVIAIADRKAESYQVPTGKDWCLTLYLFDPTMGKDFSTINLFAEQKFNLPIVEDGDVVILSSINAKAGTLTGYKSFQFAVLKQLDLQKNTVPPCEMKPYRIRYAKEEIEYARELLGWTFAEGERNRPANDGSAPRSALEITAERKILSRGTSTARKLVLFKDCQPGEFVNFRGEVVKMYKPRGNTEIMDIYITDYTENKLAFVYDFDQTDWDGPIGQFVLKCAIDKPFPTFTTTANSNKPFVEINNLRITEEIGLIKGGTWLDPKYPTKVAVNIVSTAIAPDFVSRRDEYWKEHRAKKRAWKASTDLKDPNEPESEDAAETQAESSKPIVKCTFFKDPLRSILSMRKLRIVNEVYHLRGEVKGWLPKKLNEWIKAKCSNCDSELPMGLLRCPDHEEEIPVIYLEFILQIIDASEIGEEDPTELKVFVSRTNWRLFLPGLKPISEWREPDANLAILKQYTDRFLGQNLHEASTFDFAVTRAEGNRICSFVGTSLHPTGEA